MIRISLGKVGSGKTANEVREIFLNKANRKTYTNIKTNINHQIDISQDMIFSKEIIKTVKKRGGEAEPVYKYNLNVDYWKNLKEPINVVLDEAHAIINSRRSMNKKNIIVTDWLALLRRVLGQSESGYGELVLITQLPFRIDVIAREMANQIRYHVCHYTKTCLDCGCYWRENSEVTESLWSCPYCNKARIKKHSHFLEIWHFDSMKSYLDWSISGMKSYYRRYYVNDIERYFPMYNTLQWENLFTD